jgi:hypothetical protein
MWHSKQVKAQYLECHIKSPSCCSSYPEVFNTWMVLQNEFLSKVPIPQENLITIDDWDVCSAAANGYENRLKYVIAMFALFLLRKASIVFLKTQRLG